MKITNVNVYGMKESIIASGYPMRIEFPVDMETMLLEQSDLSRAAKLAGTAIGTGHDNFLSGIVVQCDVTGTNAWWLQMGRYHFVQIVSSQSKMHRLRRMLVTGGQGAFNPKTLTPMLPPDIDDEALVYSCPLGLELTARISTNYRQLKTIYCQRKNHRLTEWRKFCAWIEELPNAKEWFCN